MTPLFFIKGDKMISRLVKDFIFAITTTLYMCNVIQYNNNYKSLRKRR